MIKYLSNYRPWLLIATGMLLAAGAVLALSILTRWASDAWPAGTAHFLVAHLVLAAGAAWAISGVFIEAVFYKWRQVQVEEALDAISDLYCSFKIEPAPEDHGTHVGVEYGTEAADEHLKAVLRKAASRG